MVIIPGVKVFGPDASEFEVLEYIGNGSFGMVHKVKQIGGPSALAMKTIPTSFADDATLKAFVNECNLALGIHHPNVIQYLYFHDGMRHAGFGIAQLFAT